MTLSLCRGTQEGTTVPNSSPTSIWRPDVDILGPEIGASAFAGIPTGRTIFCCDIGMYSAGVMLDAAIQDGDPDDANARSEINAISFASGSLYRLRAASDAAGRVWAGSCVTGA